MPFQKFKRKGHDDFPIGTVYEKTAESLTVAFKDELPEWLEEGPSHYQLHRSVNRSNYKKMYEALDGVFETQNTSLAFLRDISLGARKGSCQKYPRCPKSSGRTSV